MGRIMPQTIPPDNIKSDWLARLSKLIDQIELWARQAGWSTRRIDASLSDSEIGNYKAPALLLQENTTKMLLEPIARSAPGADGVVDLYLMPAYDDLASLYFCDGTWLIHYIPSGLPPTGQLPEADSRLLTSESFLQVLEAIKNHADEQI
jgi:hypothetical protein